MSGTAGPIRFEASSQVEREAISSRVARSFSMPCSRSRATSTLARPPPPHELRRGSEGWVSRRTRPTTDGRSRHSENPTASRQSHLALTADAGELLACEPSAGARWQAAAAGVAHRWVALAHRAPLGRTIRRHGGGGHENAEGEHRFDPLADDPARRLARPAVRGGVDGAPPAHDFRRHVRLDAQRAQGRMTLAGSQPRAAPDVAIVGPARVGPWRAPPDARPWR